MPQDIKNLFDITKESIIDYENIYNSYLEKMTILIGEEYMLEASSYAILKINEINKIESFDLISSIEENVKRNYYVKTRRVKVLN